MVFECCSNSRAKKLLKSGVLFTLINMSLLLQLLNLLKTCGLMMVISKNKQTLANYPPDTQALIWGSFLISLTSGPDKS